MMRKSAIESDVGGGVDAEADPKIMMENYYRVRCRGSNVDAKV